MGLGASVKRLAGWIAPGAVVVTGPTGSGAAAITFDDGPHPENTPHILDTLDAHDAKATFFLQGNMATAHPAIVRNIIERGHQIGNHGHSHPDAKQVPVPVYVADVERCQSVLEDIVGHQLPRNFRPPYGHITPSSTLALVRKGFRFIFWSLDSNDSFVPDAAALVAYVKASPLRAGSIVLFHDDYAHTTAALPALLAHVKDSGLKMVTIGKLLGETNS